MEYLSDLNPNYKGLALSLPKPLARPKHTAAWDSSAEAYLKASHQELDAVEVAILRTVAYADIFDYPLTAGEVHRYLVGASASTTKIQFIVGNGRLVPQHLAHRQGYFTLPGREGIVETRHRRAEIAARIWPRATRYGSIIGNFPFVRMVAVTGALAVDNVESEGDIDYLIVTEPDRLWLCRAMIIALVRLAARRGDVICPNYFLSERALFIREHNLFTAHELAQMVPISGMATYRRMCQLNDWVAHFLPNAYGPPWYAHIQPRCFPCTGPSDTLQVWQPIRDLAETLLRTGLGARLERWEMTRKVRKFSGQRGVSAPRTHQEHNWPNPADRKSEAPPRSEDADEASFCADWCKGHFNGHGQHTLEAFADRLQTLALTLPPGFGSSERASKEMPGGLV